MPKELLELLKKIKAKKEEASNLLNEKKLDEAESVTNEIKAMQREFEIKASLFEEVRDNLPIEGMKNKTSKDLGIILAKAITGRATPEEVKNLMQENTPEGSSDKGGVTVPKDVKTRIMELQRKSFDVRKYISIEPVETNRGVDQLKLMNLRPQVLQVWMKEQRSKLYTNQSLMNLSI